MNIKKLIDKMTLKEKLEQLTQLNAGFFDKNAGTEATGPLGELGLNTDNLKGTGSVLNFQGPDSVKALQKQHLDDDPNKIPMMFMMDVVHGCRTRAFGLVGVFRPAACQRLLRHGGKGSRRRGNKRHVCAHGGPCARRTLGQSHGVYGRGPLP